jgi:hypothetical protein
LEKYRSKDTLKTKKTKMKRFWRFSITRSKGENILNCQIFTFDFHCVAKNRRRIRVLYFKSSLQPDLAKSSYDCHFGYKQKSLGKKRAKKVVAK